MDIVEVLPGDTFTLVGTLLFVAVAALAVLAFLTPSKKDDEALMRLLDHIARLRSDIEELRRHNSKTDSGSQTP